MLCILPSQRGVEPSAESQIQGVVGGAGDDPLVHRTGTRVAVMYLGSLCEVTKTRTLFERPRHPYTQALLSAIPRLEDEHPQHIKLKGEVPTPIHLPSGCVFHGRCIHANERCTREVPTLTSVEDGTQVACHAVEERRI